MSLFFLFTWLGLFASFSMLAFKKPVWGLVLYMLTFFALPDCFPWWGGPIAGYRWNLLAGIVLVAAVMLSGNVGKYLAQKSDAARNGMVLTLAMAILANATLVHLFLAEDLSVSAVPYYALAKNILLVFLIIVSARTEGDFRIVLSSMVLGAGYIGWEATFGGRAILSSGRLENIGAPNATGSNDLASLMVTVLPIAGALFLAVGNRMKVLMVVCIGLIINTILLCNSRAGFLGAIASAVVFLVASPRKTRNAALKYLCLGAFAVWFLLGDVRIVNRFKTIFASKEERDYNAVSRLNYWQAGLAHIRDYPLGAGGHGYRKMHSEQYLKMIGYYEGRARSVHNGYLNITSDWGLQGLALMLAMTFSAGLGVYRTMIFRQYSDTPSIPLMGACLLGSLAAHLVVSMFGDGLSDEWNLWCIALAVCYSAIYGVVNEERALANAGKAGGIRQLADIAQGGQ
jgi:putative inorganic carbon (hco3(-)) transporter